MISTPPLRQNDPLAGETVTLLVKILPLAGGEPGHREDRPVILALGLPGEEPVVTQGRLAELTALIALGWPALARNHQEQGASQAGPPYHAQAPGPTGEADDLPDAGAAAESADGAAPPAPTGRPEATTPAKSKSNLTLF
ncbi:MAG: hypothetical protein KDE09_14030 [Anaerolineales bacterium]|nr:hypothetical protein [Anaerolineales bacterium]MCB0030764.1 hypothetical protein [Anaerolineales bacterium]